MKIEEVSAYSLKHNFAPHILETGIDLRYIPKLLEHKSSIIIW